MNYFGTAPAMEVEGVRRVFGRSSEKRNLHYTEYYGDGDSKVFTKYYGNGDSKAHEAVKFIYGLYCVIKKLECIGHYQKRVGCRLRRLKKGLKGLTPAIIYKLQNYFGIALRAKRLCRKQFGLVSFMWLAMKKTITIRILKHLLQAGANTKET